MKSGTRYYDWDGNGFEKTEKPWWAGVTTSHDLLRLGRRLCRSRCSCSFCGSCVYCNGALLMPPHAASRRRDAARSGWRFHG